MKKYNNSIQKKINSLVKNFNESNESEKINKKNEIKLDTEIKKVIKYREEKPISTKILLKK